MWNCRELSQQNIRIQCRVVVSFSVFTQIRWYRSKTWATMFYSKKIRTARDLRQHLVNRKALELCAKGFWNRNISVDLDNLWSIAFRATKETRLRVLHWKIRHNIYPTNILLCKMKEKENNKCTYCDKLCRLYWTFLLWMSCCSRFLAIHWTAYFD